MEGSLGGAGLGAGAGGLAMWEEEPLIWAEVVPRCEEEMRAFA